MRFFEKGNNKPKNYWQYRKRTTPILSTAAKHKQTIEFVGCERSLFFNS